MVVGNLRILIIEPDENFQSILKRKLRRDRSIITFIKNVKQCSKIDLDRFDIILLGENTRDGIASEAYDVIRELGFSGFIVIMTTSKHFQRDHYNGISAAINKPFGTDELRGLIKELGVCPVEDENTVSIIERSYVPTGS